MLSVYDYCTIQRLLGNLEGVASAIENEGIQQTMYDALATLDCIIASYKPAECEGEKS